MEYDSNDNVLSKRLCVATLFSILMTGILIAFTGPAWSLELDQSTSVTGTDENASLTTSSPESAIAKDKCLSLLKAVRYTNPPSAMDRDRRSAGQATALGLVFGVRFALGPKEVTKRDKSGDAVRFDFWQPRDRDTNAKQAMAVADYRRCVKEQNLKAISDWRWQR